MITLITNIGQLVTPEGRGAAFGPRMSDLRVYESAEILLEGERILSIGSLGDHTHADEIIDAEGNAVLPGLIDPHRHLRLPPAMEATNDSGPIRLDVVMGETRLLRGFRRAVAEGTTTVEVKCATDGAGASVIEDLALARRVGRVTPLRVSSTLLGDCPDSERRGRDDQISALISEVIPAARRRRLAQFCDVTCGEGGYSLREAETILRAGRGAGFRPKIHGMGRELDQAAVLGSKLGAASVDHLSSCGKRASAVLRRSGAVCVLLPGTAFFFDRPYPEARRMIDSGMAVALGTDFGFSGHGVESHWVGLSVAVEKLKMGIEEAICASTLNAAAALEVADEVGSIEPGKLADLAILDLDDYRDIAGSIGSNPVRMTIIAGRVVHSS